MTIVTILVLLVFSATQATGCSGHSTAGACGGDVNCTWNVGRCSEFSAEDCAIGNGCPLGCLYSAGTRGSCENTATCGPTDCDGGVSICEMSTGTCIASGSPASCPTEVEYQFSCEYTPGCVLDEYSVSCEVQSNSGPNCDSISVVPRTECTDDYRCEWSNNACVSKSEYSSKDCSSYSNEPVSRCLWNDYCKVESGSCIYNSSVSTAELDEHCGSVEDCSNPDDYCPPDPPCPEGESCPHSDCFGEVKCKVSGGKCVFAADEYCGSISTAPYTACGDSYSDWCKISNGKCVNLTADELCSKYSVARMSECDFTSMNSSSYYQCHPSADGRCLANTNDQHNIDICSGLSTVIPTSECQKSSGNRCEISSDGVCVSRTLVCSLNQAGTNCSNPSTDACYLRFAGSCKNVVCGDYTQSYNCPTTGCTWEVDNKNCIPISCGVRADGSCYSSNANCQSTYGTASSCGVDNTIVCNKQTTSECNAVLGCKWDYTLGGSCAEKTCANDPSYARCCSSADCAYCSGESKPSDCLQDPLCESNPTHSNCCPGVGCTGFCAEHPEDSGCKSAAYRIIAPVFSFLLLILFVNTYFTV